MGKGRLLSGTVYRNGRRNIPENNHTKLKIHNKILKRRAG